MSCYSRYLKYILSEAGIDVTQSNKKQLDQTIHNTVGITYEDCPAIWKKLKQEIVSNEQNKQ